MLMPSSGMSLACNQLALVDKVRLRSLTILSSAVSAKARPNEFLSIEPLTWIEGLLNTHSLRLIAEEPYSSEPT